MAELGESKYGPLGWLVTGAGNIMAVAVALMLAFRDRGDWEPSEQDISGGPQRVACLIVGVFIVIILVRMSRPASHHRLTKLAEKLAATCVISLLLYGYLVGMQIYTVKRVPLHDGVVTEKIIGGFWLTPGAKDAIAKYHVTTQEILAGAGYDPDRVWSRGSRALAKLCFVVCYLGLMVCASLALACASIILGQRGKRLPPGCT